MENKEKVRKRMRGEEIDPKVLKDGNRIEERSRIRKRRRMRRRKRGG